MVDSFSGPMGIGTSSPRSGAQLDVENGSLYLAVTNPTMTTPDFSFASSWKSLAVQTTWNGSAPGNGIVGIGSQLDTTGASGLASAQAITGGIKVGVDSEHVGVFGYVDIESSGGIAHGVWGIVRGSTAGAQSTALHCTSETSSGVHPTAGLLVEANPDIDNNFQYSIQINPAGTNAGVYIRGQNDNNGALWWGLNHSGSTTSVIRAGGGFESANNSYGGLSDMRIKSNVRDTSPALEQMVRVRVVDFYNKRTGRDQTNIVAQELEQIFPDLVYEVPDQEFGTVKIANLMGVVPRLIKALQELTTRVGELEVRLPREQQFVPPACDSHGRDAAAVPAG